MSDDVTSSNVPMEEWLAYKYHAFDIRLDTLEEATILYRRIADKFGARE